MAYFRTTISILALVFAIGCSGKSGLEPDDFPTYVEQDGVSLKIGYVENSNDPHPTASISFCVPEKGRAILTLINATGYLVKVLYDEEREVGCEIVYYAVTNKDGEPLKNGIYLVRIQFRDVVDFKVIVFKF